MCVYLTETRHEFILVMLTVVHKKNELMFNIPFFVHNARLAESKTRYDHQREKYEKMIENKRKEIADLEIKCVCVCVCMCVFC